MISRVKVTRDRLGPFWRISTTPSVPKPFLPLAGNTLRLRWLTAIGITTFFAWALQRHIERAGWEVVNISGYRRDEPVFSNVATSFEHKENLIACGRLTLKKGGTTLVASVDVLETGSIIIQGPYRCKDEIDSFVAAINQIVKEENFYRGAKLEFARGLHFIDPKLQNWDSVVLKEDLKQEIQSNTVEFLRHSDVWAGLGIPLKRGVLFEGPPGVGKTLACRAIISDAASSPMLTI